MYTNLISLLLAVNLISPYLSSWFNNILPFPPGAMLRDIISFVLIAIILSRVFLVREKLDMFKVFLLFTWLSLAALVLVLIVYSPDKIQAIMGARSYILFPSIFICVAMLTRREKSDVNVYKLSRFSVYTLTICALIAIIDVFMHGEFIKLLGYDSHYAGEQFRLIDSYDDTIRATGGFSDALNFGYTLAIGIFLCMECYAQRIMRKRMLILSIIMSVAVCMTLTRGAILIVFLIYFAYFVTNRTLIKTAFVLCILMIPVIALQTDYLDKYTDLLVGRFTDSSATSKGSTQGRFDMAAKSMAYLADNPMGVGLGTQGSGNLIAQDDKRINTDNYFFWMALETGILGLILNLIYISTQFIYGFSRQLVSEKIHPLRPYMVMAMAYFIASALSSAPSSSTFSLFFWCVLALLPGLKLHKGYYEKNHNG